MEKIKIVKARPEDWKAIRNIQKNDGYPHTYYIDKKRVCRLMKRGEIFFLAILNGKPVGFASVDFEIRATLHFLSVMKDEQGKGIATMLLKAVIKETAKRKYDQIIAFTEKEGVNVNNFLKDYGFEEVGYHKDRYGKEKDAIIWRLEIKKLNFVK